jgi:hypothetical protein
MATAQGLAGCSLLVRVEIALDPDEQPQRMVYVLPAVRDWMATVLPNLASDGYFPGAATPFEQADALLYDFVIGKPAFEMAPRCMRPCERGVWELRTYDLRFFGFFWRRGIFIATSADTKARCKTPGAYAQHRSNAVRTRDELDLDPPKFMTGSDPDDIL